MIIGFLGLFGVALVVMMPFIVGRRFGWHVVLYILAIVSGLYAINSSWLIETAKQVETCIGHSPTCQFMQSSAALIFKIDQIGWWSITGFILFNGIILHTVRVFGGIPVPHILMRDCRSDSCSWEQNLQAKGTIGACNTCRHKK